MVFTYLIEVSAASDETVVLIDMDPSIPGIQTQRDIRGLNIPFTIAVYIGDVNRMVSFGGELIVNRNLFSYINDYMGEFPESLGATFIYNSVPYYSETTMRNGAYTADWNLVPSGSGYLYFIEFRTVNYGEHYFNLMNYRVGTVEGEITPLTTGPNVLRILPASGQSSPSFMKIKPPFRIDRSQDVEIDWAFSLAALVGIILIFVIYRNFSAYRINRNRMSTKRRR